MNLKTVHQPELGRTIAELRKSRGLTQEELVDKCNLSVRTLQRIESGEVMPRMYTLKLIFAALEYEIGRTKPVFQGEGLAFSAWTGLLFRRFIDLFNLKTHTMKKLTILTVMVSAILLGIFAINSEIQAQKSKEDKPKSVLDDEVVIQNRELVFSNFYCESCLEEKGLLIGRDVKFQLCGVKMNVGLIAFDKDTREFNIGAAKGKILENRVEVAIPRDMLMDSHITYFADKMEKTDNTILLKGNAMIVESGENGKIEADEILITMI